MKKKFGLVLAIIFALATLFFLCACEPDGNEGGGGEKVDPECPHTKWIETNVIPATCSSYEIKELACLGCNEKKTEIGTKYGQHRYMKHVCEVCGKREDVSEDYKFTSGACTIYLYAQGIVTKTYQLFVDGNGRMDDYDSPDDIPWVEYRDSVVSIGIGNGVRHIGNNAFNLHKSVYDLSLGTGIESIGDYAFCNADRLTSIEIGNSVKSVGKYAFAECDILETLVFSKNTVNIEPFALYGSRLLRNLTVSVPYAGGNAEYERYFGSLFGYTNDADEIENVCRQKVTINGKDYGFYVASYLRSLTVLSDGSVPAEVFMNCSCITSITFEGNITKVEKRAFSGMDRLEIVNFKKDMVTEIEGYAFADCISLGQDRESEIEGEPAIKQDFIVPTNVTTLGNNVFFGCRALLTVRFNGNGVTRIPFGTFENCTMLKNVYLPESLQFIDARAFHACSGMESITIPENVKNIGTDAFENCTNLIKIYLESKDIINTGLKDNSKLFSKAKYVYLYNMDKSVVKDGTYLGVNFQYKSQNEHKEHSLFIRKKN